ncbi:hypothetical protein EJ06DRAFT_521703 [Trichodelitschia bisporula]|uniref:Uncharacterized protein n=1 Tax=Trichodelitschia bisporula TaxID=703511 RepID=A0A6G1HW70_9PEZI|nr:hypothetical protein EJ06DRAFT_521703 [Trichodelitschia bisporula]
MAGPTRLQTVKTSGSASGMMAERKLNSSALNSKRSACEVALEHRMLVRLHMPTRGMKRLVSRHQKIREVAPRGSRDARAGVAGPTGYPREMEDLHGQSIPGRIRELDHSAWAFSIRWTKTPENGLATKVSRQLTLDPLPVGFTIECRGS